MEEESKAFYLVRKGEMIGIYKSLSDCQALAGTSVCDPSISVFKGYNMPKDAEDLLRTHGLKNASYSISINDVKDGLFGKLGSLVPCPFQETVGCSALSTTPKKKFKSDGSLSSIATSTVSSSRVCSSLPTVVQNKSSNLDGSMTSCGTQSVSLTFDSCTLEFDGASKGNPGLAGAGAILRASDGSAIWRLREGVGHATNNVAEYRAVLLGLKYALKKGFKHIRVQGDSKLVSMQIQGQWKTKNPNMADLCKQAKKLKEKFVSFQIKHIPRELNSEADVQANQAINLQDGQVEEDCEKM